MLEKESLKESYRIETAICISVPPVFCGKFSKIQRKYFINSAADLSKFRSYSAEIILTFNINYK